MPHPSGNRHEIDPGHHAVTDEVVPQVVKPELLDAGGNAYQPHRLHKALGRFVLLAALRRGKQPFRIRCPAGVHRFQMLLQDIVKVHHTSLAVFCQPIRANGQLPVNFEENLNQPRHCWYPFKEGFSNQMVAEAVRQSAIGKTRPLLVVDPFGGSGTTALTSALLGHDSISIEVNPFCSFTTRVKCLAGGWHDNNFRNHAAEIAKTANRRDTPSPLEGISTFTERKGNEKWLFNKEVIRAFTATWRTIAGRESSYTPAFKLAAVRAAMDLCNAKKDGKCLRYVKNWKSLKYGNSEFFEHFSNVTSRMLNDVKIAPIDRKRQIKVVSGDTRLKLASIEDRSCDLLVTSPPYLNSFDYSDIYRPELFLGGFVDSNDQLRKIRLQTVRSHVQVKWGGETAVDNPMVEACVNALKAKRKFWNKKIPMMVEAYFHDMRSVLEDAARILKNGAEAWIVVSTSAYKGVHIPVDLILADLSAEFGFQLNGIYTLRALRAAGQQQHRFDIPGLPLRESLIILKR